MILPFFFSKYGFKFFMFSVSSLSVSSKSCVGCPLQLFFNSIPSLLSLVCVVALMDAEIAAGAQLGNFEMGRRYIYSRKDEIIHGLSPSV